MPRARTGERRQQILETLMRLLQEPLGAGVTTAALARAVGVSEAALYRHFPSKAGMFEGLLEFIEESLFTRINRIIEEERETDARLKNILYLILGFCSKNPGLARLLYGDVLTGEAERLRRRVAQIFDRIETQLKQILREAELANMLRQPVPETAGLLLAVVEGRIARFVHSGFRLPPAAGWESQWDILKEGIFRSRVGGV